MYAHASSSVWYVWMMVSFCLTPHISGEPRFPLCLLDAFRTLDEYIEFLDGQMKSTCDDVAQVALIVPAHVIEQGRQRRLTRHARKLVFADAICLGRLAVLYELL
jgi:hypothetical protein